MVDIKREIYNDVNIFYYTWLGLGKVAGWVKNDDDGLGDGVGIDGTVVYGTDFGSKFLNTLYLY